MKVKFICDKGGNGYIKKNEIYTVYTIFMSEEGLCYLLSNPKESKNLPMAHLAEMFEIIDNVLPIMWHFNYTSKTRSNTSIKAIWGYKEIVQNPNHYVDLIEREPYALEIFAKRKAEIDEYEDLLKNK